MEEGHTDAGSAADTKDRKEGQARMIPRKVLRRRMGNEMRLRVLMKRGFHVDVRECLIEWWFRLRDYWIWSGLASS